MTSYATAARMWQQLNTCMGIKLPQLRHCFLLLLLLLFLLLFSSTSSIVSFLSFISFPPPPRQLDMRLPKVPLLLDCSPFCFGFLGEESFGMGVELNHHPQTPFRVRSCSSMWCYASVSRLLLSRPRNPLSAPESDREWPELPWSRLDPFNFQISIGKF